MSIYRVEPRARVVEANGPYEAALKAGCVPGGCIVTEITEKVLNLQAEGDLQILKGEEIKG